ncbi:MAG: hypothetical protein R3F65_20480 [bacterium]
MTCRPALALLAALLAPLTGCWDRESTNPYDPEARDTVRGQLRVDFELPPAVAGDELQDPRVRLAALDELRVVATPVDGPGAHEATAEPDGTRTLTAPAGRYTVTVTHRRGVFEPATAPVELTLAERRDLLVQLRRAELRVSARFKYATAPIAPLGAWMQLGWLPDDAPGDCLLAEPIRRFALDGQSALLEVIHRPISRRVCAALGAPGYETLTLAPITLQGPTLDLGLLELTESPAEVRLLGLPEARRLEDGRSILGTRRVGGRLVLLHIRLTAGLSFDPQAPAEQRVRRIAVVDGSPTQDSAPYERFVRLDRLPFEGSGDGALPFIGAMAPSRCAAFDPTSTELNELLVQSPALHAEIARRHHLADGGGDPEERLLPYCLLGDDADTRLLTVALETESGAIHRARAEFAVDRRPPSAVRIEVDEDRPAIDGQPPQSRPVPTWRGRYQIHADADVQVVVEEVDPDPFEVQVQGLTWRVAHVVQSGERYAGGWRFRSCPDPLVIDFDAPEPPPADLDAGLPDLDAGRPDLDAAAPTDAGLDAAPAAPDAPDAGIPQPPPATGRGVATGAVGARIALPVRLVPPLPPQTGHPDAFRVHRNRVCLYIEDAAGNLRQDALDIEVFAGRLRATLRAGASAEDDTPRWVGVDCPITIPPDACQGFDDPLLVSDEIVFQTHVDPDSVDRTVHDVSLLDGESTYGLRQMTVRIDQAALAPQPFRQDRRLVYGFEADGAHRLQVTGTDLLGRPVEFTYGDDAAPTVTFLRDTRAPRTLARNFLTCTACAAAVAPCCDPNSPRGECLVTDNPCVGCVTEEFVIADEVLVAPASAEVPVRFAFDFDFPGAEDRLCAVTHRVGDESLAFRSLCTNSVTLPPPDEITVDEAGTLVEYKTDIYDAACNDDIDLGSLAVLYDRYPPRIQGDDTGRPATAITCRALNEVCDGDRTCWRVQTSRDACAQGGLRVLENLGLTLIDAASAALAGPAIRYRLIVADTDDDPTIPAVCDEPPWRIADQRPDQEPRRRRAICTPSPACGCVGHGAVPALRAPLELPQPPIPLALWRDDRLVTLTLTDFTDAGARVVRGRIWLAAEDAVGNVAVVPLQDDLCEGDDCARRRYEIPVRPIPGDPDLDDPAWHEIQGCRLVGDTGTRTPDGNHRRPPTLADAFCD